MRTKNTVDTLERFDFFIGLWWLFMLMVPMVVVGNMDFEFLGNSFSLFFSKSWYRGMEMNL